MKLAENRSERSHAHGRRHPTGVELPAGSANRVQVNPLILVPTFRAATSLGSGGISTSGFLRTKAQRRIEAPWTRRALFVGTFRGVSLGAGDLRTPVFR